jgi:hypothetical protein
MYVEYCLVTKCSDNLISDLSSYTVHSPQSTVHRVYRVYRGNLLLDLGLGASGLGVGVASTLMPETASMKLNSISRLLFLIHG